ncbi:hypothetical protein CA13_31480 [Planctomycetes bacterium CA13]|uniref:Uncharacterized protein n=1 Tax=Novipirellula herctigrandis TaxID=2527986 RepID=A0A5C5Z3C4_9BACT|nr:hypothetical protein CA13_31480 [Planctomycetes bacterium CA13]
MLRDRRATLVVVQTGPPIEIVVGRIAVDSEIVDQLPELSWQRVAVAFKKPRKADKIEQSPAVDCVVLEVGERIVERQVAFVSECPAHRPREQVIGAIHFGVDRWITFVVVGWQ